MKTATVTDAQRTEKQCQDEVERLLGEMQQMSQRTAAHQAQTARLRAETQELLRSFKVR